MLAWPRCSRWGCWTGCELPDVLVRGVGSTRSALPTSDMREISSVGELNPVKNAKVGAPFELAVQLESEGSHKDDRPGAHPPLF
jgi:hypothetical protein